MSLTRYLSKRVLLAAIVAVTVTSGSQTALARVRLENICTIYGAKETRLVGIGLVTGLNGTGDSSRNAPAMRALAQTMKLLNLPVQDLRELRGVKNIAVVRIDATIPRHGVRIGQKIDCYVSAMMDAKDLRGGRLMSAPVEDASIKDDSVAGVASGAIVLEDSKSKTVGKIPGGIVIQKNFEMKFISSKGFITLLLDKNHSSFNSASEIARRINEDFELEAGYKIAKAAAPNAINVLIPKSYEKAPVEFVSNVLDVTVDQPHTHARVVINAKSNTVVVTGEVEVSPTIVSIDGLQVNTRATGAFGNPDTGSPFVPIPDRRTPQSTSNLKDLIDALRELRVSTADVIKVLRTLDRTGKLHAELIEE